MAGCKPKKFAKGGFAYSGGKSLTDPKSGRPTGLGPVVLEPPRRAPAPAPMAPPRPTPAPPAPMAPPRPTPAPPAPMMGGSKSLKDPVSGRATGLGPLVQEPPRPAPAPPMPPRPAPAALLRAVPPPPMPPRPAPMMGRAFKKGGMVNAKVSSCRPRGSSGKGVKACKVC